MAEAFKNGPNKVTIYNDDGRPISWFSTYLTYLQEVVKRANSQPEGFHL